MNIEQLSADQQTAIDKMEAWWGDIPSIGKHRLPISDNDFTRKFILNPDLYTDAGWGVANYKFKEPYQTFVLTGAAGTGKSTVVQTALEAMGINPDEALMVATAATAVKNIQAKNPQAMASTIAGLIKAPIRFLNFKQKNHIIKVRRESGDSKYPDDLYDALYGAVTEKQMSLEDALTQELRKTNPDKGAIKQINWRLKQINNSDFITEDLFDSLSNDEISEAIEKLGYTFKRTTQFDIAEQPGNKYTTPWEEQHNTIRAIAFKNDNVAMLHEWERTHPYHKIPKIIIVDELGMVSQSDYDVICEIGIPILALGDPYQLPAIGNKDNRNQSIHEPDAMLTTIHRQDQDAMLLEVANAAKNGKNYLKTALMATKQKAKDVYYNPKHTWRVKDYLGADIILSPTNKGVINYNRACHHYYAKQHTKKHRDVILAPGEPLIITNNTNEKTKSGVSLLANGQSVIVKHIHHIDHDECIACVDIQADGKILEKIWIDISDLPNPKINDNTLRQTRAGLKLLNQREAYDFWHTHPSPLHEVVYVSYGYAMTIHKSQGKEWGNVLLDSEVPWVMQSDADKLIYTAITRAKRKLVIM